MKRIRRLAESENLIDEKSGADTETSNSRWYLHTILPLRSFADFTSRLRQRRTHSPPHHPQLKPTPILAPDFKASEDSEGSLRLRSPHRKAKPLSSAMFSSMSPRLMSPRSPAALGLLISRRSRIPPVCMSVLSPSSSPLLLLRVFSSAQRGPQAAAAAGPLTGNPKPEKAKWKSKKERGRSALFFAKKVRAYLRNRQTEAPQVPTRSPSHSSSPSPPSAQSRAVRAQYQIMKTATTYKSVVSSHNNTIFRRRTSQALSSLRDTSSVLSLFESSKHHVDPLLLPAFLAHPRVKDPDVAADLLPLVEFSLGQLGSRTFSPVAYSTVYSAVADALAHVLPRYEIVGRRCVRKYRPWALMSQLVANTVPLQL